MRRLLVIRLSALGDVAMTVPAVYSLARRYPTLQIDVLTRPFFARLFVDPPANVHLIAADFKGEYKGVCGLWRLLRRLTALRPDGVADLHNVLRSWVIDAWFRLRGVRVAMVDKNRRSRRNLFRTKEPQRNFTERYADVFAALGFPVTLDFTSLFAEGGAVPPCVPPTPCVGIAPFARYGNKTYPPEQMRRVVELLCSRGVGVWLFGSRGAEAATLEAWAAAIEGCESVAGRYTIEEELALMSCMDVMVSMDSANHHLASLAGIPVVSIWGSTTPACGFMGYGQPAANALCLDLPCQPCSVAGKPACPKGHLDCLNRLEPQTIADKVASLLPTAIRS